MFGTKNVSLLIQSSINPLMLDWETRVRKELPGTAKLNRENLFNGLPDFLTNLALQFSTAKDSEAWDKLIKETREAAKRHGQQRANQTGYTLDQVIAEHQILRRVLFHFIQDRVRLAPEEWNTFVESVDVGISEAATAFALERGFKDARYRQLESEKEVAQGETHRAHSEVDKLQFERASREQFVSTLSHDLRTPITSAKLAAELITHNPSDREQVARLAFKVIDDLSRTDRMIRDLLDANRIRSGEKLGLDLQQMKLVESVRKTLGSLSLVYGNRFNLSADREIVGYWSATDLERSVENLAINAIKYGAPDAPVNVRIDDQGEKVSISVHNTGSLITRSEQEALFQPFSRILTTGTKGKKGWGLGLTLVMGIAEAHGGKVQVQSEPDQGTTFTITLPKDARSAKEKQATQARAS